MRKSGLLALLVVAACSSVPETNYYLLTSSIPAQAMGAGAARATLPLGGRADAVIGVGSIEVPDYLQQQGIVLETAEYQIRPATYERWGEPLARGIRRALVENLTAALPGVRVESVSGSERRPDYRLDLEIERFHGTEQGAVVLGGRWSIHHVDGHRLLASEQFSYQEDITRSGYRASVEAQARLLARLSEAIAARLASVEAASG